MRQIETSKMQGIVTIVHYSYDEEKDRTNVIVQLDASWEQPPLFQMTDLCSIVVKGSDASFAMINSSSSACYLDQERYWFVHDIFELHYTSMDVVEYRIPTKLNCKDGSSGIIHTIHLVYHAIASGKISIIEATACYEHQAFTPNMNFSLIGAFTTLGSASPLEIVPTLTLSGNFPRKEIWCKVKRAELTAEGFDTSVTSVQQGVTQSDYTDFDVSEVLPFL